MICANLCINGVLLKMMTDCRNIYNEAKKYNIYVGEFIKAILKINKICSELVNICEIQNNIKLLHTLNCCQGKNFKIDCYQSIIIFIIKKLK